MYHAITDRQWPIIRTKLHLTNREMEVAQLICQGLSSKGVANQLGLKTSTISWYKRTVYRLLGVKSSVGLLLKCQETLDELKIEKEQPVGVGKLSLLSDD